MNRLTEILHWLEIRRDLGYALIRIFLGVALFVRGWILVSDPSAITEMAGVQQVYWWYAFIIGAHLLGGFLMAIGFLTRLGVALQIPVLAGAVFFIHMEQGLMTVGQSLELAVLVLVLLLVFFFFGPGTLSVNHYMDRKK